MAGGSVPTGVGSTLICFCLTTITIVTSPCTVTPVAIDKILEKEGGNQRRGKGEGERGRRKGRGRREGVGGGRKREGEGERKKGGGRGRRGSGEGERGREEGRGRRGGGGGGGRGRGGVGREKEGGRRGEHEVWQVERFFQILVAGHAAVAIHSQYIFLHFGRGLDCIH